MCRAHDLAGVGPFYGITGMLVTIAACAIVHLGVIERMESRRRRARRSMPQAPE